MQIIVTLERMLCAKSANHWFFFKALMGGDGVSETTVVCKGVMGWEPQEMETLALIGDWVEYKGERQFQFKSAKLTLPLEPRSQLHYVCQRAHGIGTATEQAIWNARKEDWRNLQRGEIRKMSSAVFDSFVEQINGFENNSEKAEIISWLENKGCSEGMAAAAYETWGSDTAGIVNADCYRLANLPGFSFKTVDENVRRNFDIADEDPRRIKSAVEYAVQQETSDGSTALECWKHLSACQKLLPNIGDNLIIQYVKEMKESGNVYVFRDQGMMALKNDYLNELMIYEFVKNSIHAPDAEITMPADEELSAGEKFTPDESQFAAVKFAVGKKFAIINGGAGVGKTTVIKMIVRGIEKTRKDLAVVLCAPTGKAAARLKEASGIVATTIHVALGSQGQTNVFCAGSFEKKAIIIDESSMVESAILAEIVKRNPAKLILVGDQAQLTPVGHGQPLHDIIQLHPEAVRTLTKCYRATEAVFQAATQIRNGNTPVRHAESASEKWTITQAANPQEAQEMICAWAQNDILDFEKDIILCPKNGTRDESDDFQPATVNAMNDKLLWIDREKRGTIAGDKYLAGDRVINTVNNPEKHVWNGTTGTVQTVDDAGNVYLHLDVPYKDDLTGEIKDSVCLAKKTDVPALRYAYALTVHKSQGSQYRKVIMVALTRDKFQMDRSLIYTGVTRTKEECIVVGNYDAFISGINTIRKKNTVMQCLKEEGI